MNTLLSRYYAKSIRLTPDGFSLYKVDGDEIQKKDFSNNQNVLITTEAPAFFNLDNQDLQPVDIVVATHPAMLVPDALYQEDKAQEYLKLQFDITQIGQHFSDQVSHYRALYFLTQNESSTINELRCVPKFKSEASLLYQFLSEQNVADCVMLSINDSFADVVVLHQNEPTLVNRITRMENVDILYYTLNCVMQFGLSEPTFFVHYFNKPNKKLNELLKQYHSNVIVL